MSYWDGFCRGEDDQGQNLAKLLPLKLTLQTRASLAMNTICTGRSLSGGWRLSGL